MVVRVAGLALAATVMVGVQVYLAITQGKWMLWSGLVFWIVMVLAIGHAAGRCWPDRRPRGPWARLVAAVSIFAAMAFPWYLASAVGQN